MDPNEQEPDTVVIGLSGQEYKTVKVPDENLHGGEADKLVHEQGVIYNAPYDE